MTEETTTFPSEVSRRSLLRTATTVTVAPLLGAGRARGQQATEITDWHELDAVRDAPDDDYLLTTDLDVGSAGYLERVLNPDGGWRPIDSFSGVFRGDGHEIVELMIDRENTTGLFGTNQGTIANLGVTNCTVSGGDAVGGLVGRNAGTVRAVSVSGTVAGDRLTGGVAGVTAGGETSGVVTESSARCTVTGRNGVGGLVGVADQGTAVTRSGARGTARGGNAVGGLIGIARGADVSESFATGSVTADAPGGGGGLVGVAGDPSTPGETTVQQSFALGDVIGALAGGLVGGGPATVRESFATGNVTGRRTAGGLVGGSIGDVSASYWDAETSGTDVGIGEAADRDVTGLETKQMQGASAQQHMDSFDFAETWRVVTAPSYYPVFRWQSDAFATEQLVEDDDSTREAASNDTSTVESDADTDDDDGSGPGFGVAGALAGLGATAYLLNRREKTAGEQTG